MTLRNRIVGYCQSSEMVFIRRELRCSFCVVICEAETTKKNFFSADETLVEADFLVLMTEALVRLAFTFQSRFYDLLERRAENFHKHRLKGKRASQSAGNLLLIIEALIARLGRPSDVLMRTMCCPSLPEKKARRDSYDSPDEPFMSSRLLFDVIASIIDNTGVGVESFTRACRCQLNSLLAVARPATSRLKAQFRVHRVEQEAKMYLKLM